MKKINVFIVTIILAMVQYSFAAGIIIDHNNIDISQIPDSWILQAKQNLKVAYSHTSHGSQPVAGMEAFKGNSGDTYYYNKTGYGLHPGVFFNDYWGNAAGANDLGHNGDLSWRNATRTLLNRSNNDRNVVIWSWCGGVQDNTHAGIQIYLDAMNELEQQYPDVTFVYMTGHANTWNDATVKASNQQIRNYCIANNKVLFDFFDIESHNPDGQYFEFVGDNCDYYSSAGGTRQGNWATEWIAANPGSDLTTIASSCGTCEHSKKLNCVLKGRAFWWLLARIAGWNGTPGEDDQAPTVPQNLTATATSASTIDLAWSASTDNVGVTGYKIFRDGSEIETTTALTYSNTGLSAITTYSYTVSAYDAAGNNSAQSAAVNATTTAKPGDVTNDGQVDLKDAVTALLVAAGLTNAPAHSNGDVNQDGRIGMAEVIFILNSVAD